jgi:hypothetical protein
MSDRWFFLLLLTLFGSMAISAFLSGDPDLALPILLVALIAIAFWALQRYLGNVALRRHGGDATAVNSDETDPIPSTNAIQEEETAVGASQEQHAELSPHDLPPGSPIRREVERQSIGRGGTTRGNADPSDEGGAVITSTDPTARTEGYAPGEQVSAPKAKTAGPSRDNAGPPKGLDVD